MRLTIGACGVVLLLAARAGAAEGPASQPADHVFSVLRGAVETYPFGTDDDAKAARAAALESVDRLKGVQWPDFQKLKFVRMELATWKDRTWVSWCVSITDTDVVLMTPGLNTVHMNRKSITKIDVIDFAAWLKEYQDGLGRKDVHAPILFEALNGTPGFTFQGISAGIAAAVRGNDDLATQTFQQAVSGVPGGGAPAVFDKYLDQLMYEAFASGAEQLAANRPRAEVLALWQNALQNIGRNRVERANADAGRRLESLADQLKLQVADDEKHAKDPAVDPAKIPQDQQIKFYIEHLPDVLGQQMTMPGRCSTLGLGEGTRYSDALVAIGRPALPALIEHLDDARVTRCVDFDYIPQSILRAGAICLDCISAIADVRFESAEDARAWYKKHGSDTPVQSQMATLNTGSIYERIETLHKIEKLDPKAVDAIAALKGWADAARADRTASGTLAVIAGELAKRGDLSMLPDMQRAVRENERGIKDQQVWFVLKYGDASDYRFMLERTRVERGADPPRMKDTWISGAVVEGLRSSSNPLAAPLLVEFLAERELTGQGSLPGSTHMTQFSRADIAMINLIALTGHNEGFAIDDDSGARFAAIDKWGAWWVKEGQAAYVKLHPEVAKVINGEGP